MNENFAKKRDENFSKRKTNGAKNASSNRFDEFFVHKSADSVTRFQQQSARRCVCEQGILHSNL
jgi:hypothetical protein